MCVCVCEFVPLTPAEVMSSTGMKTAVGYKHFYNTNTQGFTCYMCVLTYMHNTCLYLCVYFTPTSLFKNAEFLSQALG